MNRIVVLLAIICIGSGSAQAVTADLMFSEYVEGTGYNKALELFNGTGSEIDLTTLTIGIYIDGATEPGQSIALTGLLPNSGCFVLAHPDADESILAVADLVSASLIFNGNDALVLLSGEVVIDSIGQTGFDPGSEWGSGDCTTANHTLRRKPDICEGDVETADVFDPAAEWLGLASDLFDDLGSHDTNCGTIAVENSTWSLIKADYR